jgi:hypothetical protein
VRARFVTFAALAAVLALPVAGGRTPARDARAATAFTAAEDSASYAARQRVMSMTHFTPTPQPPLQFLDDSTFVQLRDAFNLAADRPRLLLIVSPTCPHCLQGAAAVERMLQDRSAQPLSVLVVWMRVTIPDRTTVPNSLVLERVHDPRAIQFWDPGRLISKTMLADLPPETWPAIADTTDKPLLVWNMGAVFAPGVRWTDRFPAPFTSGHPLGEAADSLVRALDHWRKP